jgi:putative nucleotidyltransferase with HDIG domain
MRRLGALAVILPELDRTVGVEQNEYHPDDVFWHSLKSCDCVPKGDILLRWAALLHDIGKVDAKQTLVEDEKEPRVVFYGHEKLSASVAGEVLGRLRYANEFVKRCVHLIRHHMYYYQPEWNRGTVRKFIRKIGEENLGHLFTLRTADLMSRGLEERAREVEELRRRAMDEIDAELALRIEDLAIDGHDVMKVVGVDAGERVGKILHDLFEQVLERPSINERTILLKMLEDYKGEPDSV